MNPGFGLPGCRITAGIRIPHKRRIILLTKEILIRRTGGFEMNNTDTIELLRECDAGSKMAVSAIDEVLKKVKSPDMKDVLIKSKEHHTKVGNEIHSYLLQHNSDDKEPNPMAKGMSWLKTNWKLNINENDATIADLITEGCDMGVKSLNRYLNQFEKADEKSKVVCNQLIKIEERLREELREYL